MIESRLNIIRNERNAKEPILYLEFSSSEVKLQLESTDYRTYAIFHITMLQLTFFYSLLLGIIFTNICFCHYGAESTSTIPSVNADHYTAQIKHQPAAWPISHLFNLLLTRAFHEFPSLLEWYWNQNINENSTCVKDIKWLLKKTTTSISKSRTAEDSWALESE